MKKEVPYIISFLILGIFAVVGLLQCNVELTQRQLRNMEGPTTFMSTNERFARATIRSAAQSQGVDAAILLSIVRQENPTWDINQKIPNRLGYTDDGWFGFNSYFSDYYRNTIGLMNPHDPVNSSISAAKYLALLTRFTGSPFGAVVAWNCGLTRYFHFIHGTQNLPAETLRYAGKVFTYTVEEQKRYTPGCRLV